MGVALVLPSVLGVFCFAVAPVAVVVWLAGQDWDLLGTPQPVGLDNLTSTLGDPTFWNSVWVTVLLAVLVVPAQTALGLALGVLLVRCSRGIVWHGAVLCLPWIAAPLAVGVLWRWILAPTGGLISTIAGARVGWLADPFPALVCLAVVAIWSHAGYVALIFAAALSAQPREFLEAAALDGAGPVRQLLSVRLPLLRPVMRFVLLTSTIGVVTTFDLAYSLTGGGPGRSTDTLAMHLYAEGFVSFDLGRAAVMSLIILVGIAVIASFGLRRRGER